MMRCPRQHGCTGTALAPAVRPRSAPTADTTSGSAPSPAVWSASLRRHELWQQHQRRPLDPWPLPTSGWLGPRMACTLVCGALSAWLLWRLWRTACGGLLAWCCGGRSGNLSSSISSRVSPAACNLLWTALCCLLMAVMPPLHRLRPPPALAGRAQPPQIQLTPLSSFALPPGVLASFSGLCSLILLRSGVPLPPGLSPSLLLTPSSVLSMGACSCALYH